MRGEVGSKAAEVRDALVERVLESEPEVDDALRFICQPTRQHSSADLIADATIHDDVAWNTLEPFGSDVDPGFAKPVRPPRRKRHG